MRAPIYLLAHVQIIEAAFKELALCQTQNRVEITSSFMGNMHSYFEPRAKETLQEDEDFSNRKCTNEDASEFYGAKLFSKNLLIQFSSVFPTEMSKEAHGHCYDVAEKVNHIKEVRASDTIYDAISSMPKEENAAIRKTGVGFALLLEGNI